MSLFGDNRLSLEEYFSRENNNNSSLSALVGFFNLRGWEEFKKIGNYKDARILLGRSINDNSLINKQLADPEFQEIVDDTLASKITNNYVEKLASQLQIGAPSYSEKLTLKNLLDEIDEGKVQIKLFTGSRLHAKLYIFSEPDKNNSLLGSSNLTYSGIKAIGELNTNLSKEDAEESLEWFNEKWNSRFSIDITPQLKETISNSWVSKDVVAPFDLYLKFLYLLSKDAREGLIEYSIPRIIEKDLLEYQKNAVEISSKYLQKQNGIMIGDAVGFGKTLEAVGIAGLMQSQYGYGTLVICPPNLVDMWESYLERYEIFGSKVIPMSSKTKKLLPELRRYHLVIIDESHNLRTGKRNEYTLIKDYITLNESKVVLLTATPYNKDFSDVFNQIKLFQSPDEDIGYRPESAIQHMDISEINKISDGKISTLSFFEKALVKYPNEDDMQIFMSNYLIRRTRKFLTDNYAKYDKKLKKYYFIFADGSHHYIPKRTPKIIPVDEERLGKAQKKLREQRTVDEIDGLNLPRYKLKNYFTENLNISEIKSTELKTFIEGVLKLGNNVYSFNKTFLYKRLSSSEYAFIVSATRRINSDKFWVWCLENNKNIPTGSIDNDLLEDIDEENLEIDYKNNTSLEEIYSGLQENQPSWIKAWIPVNYFKKSNLLDDLNQDIETLGNILNLVDKDDLEDDSKVMLLTKLINEDLKNKKVLIFSEFADTINFVTEKLKTNLPNINIESVTSSSNNILHTAAKFSPKSNNYDLNEGENPIDILLSTDVLSEGQNLQDASVVINYDLPWTIIKIIQRAGRIDRIGQESDSVLIYTFEPDEGIEGVINLRGRIRDRLNQNSVVFGSDDKFFGDEIESNAIENFYTGNLEVLDELEAKGVEVDIVSEAHSRWLKAVENYPDRTELIKKMPNLIYSSKTNPNDLSNVITYFQSNNKDIFINTTESDNPEILDYKRITPRAAMNIFECTPDEEGYKVGEKMIEIVKSAYLNIYKSSKEDFKGSLTGYRKKIYNLLKNNVESLLLIDPDVKKYIQLIHDEPLTNYAKNYLKPYLKKPKPEDILSAIKQLIEMNQLVLNSEQKIDKTKVILSLQI